MNTAKLEWFMSAVCSPGSCLAFEVPLLGAAVLAIVFWWYERGRNELN